MMVHGEDKPVRLFVLKQLDYGLCDTWVSDDVFVAVTDDRILSETQQRRCIYNIARITLPLQNTINDTMLLICQLFNKITPEERQISTYPKLQTWLKENLLRHQLTLWSDYLLPTGHPARSKQHLVLCPEK